MSITELIAELKPDARKLSFFCGAGVSRNSGIPTVNDTYHYLSELLTDTPDDAAVLFKLLDVNNPDKKSELPFESIMQELIANTGSLKFLDMYKLGAPNANHFLITLLAVHQKVNWIVTTNFDLLFERAFEILGWKEGNEFIVYYNEDGFTQAISAPDDHIKLIKIHGSILSEDSIRVTIETIARENLLTRRKEMVEYIFTAPVNDFLIFLGYSFSDKFDITPHINQIEGRLFPQIIVVNHTGTDLITINDIHEISAFKEKEVSGYKLTIATGTFVELLSKSLLPEADNDQPEVLALPLRDEPVEWKPFLDNWLKKAVNPCAKYLCCSKLAQELGNGFLQDKYARLAAEQLTTMPKTKWYYLVAIQAIFSDSRMTDNNLYRGDFIRRYEALRLDLEANRELTFFDKQRLLSTIVYQIAREIEITGADVWTALYLYKQSFRLDQSTDDKKGMAKALHQMGFVLIRSEDNLRFNWVGKCKRLLQASIDLKNEIGNLSGIALSLLEMGNSHYVSKQYEQAIEFYWRADKLGHEIGEYWLRGRVLTMVGTAYQKIAEDNLKLAEHYLNESITFKEQLPVDTSLAISYNNMAEVMAMQEHFKDSMDFYKKALTIYRQSNHISAVRCMLNQLYLLKKMGNNFDDLYFKDLVKEFKTTILLVKDPPTKQKFEKQFDELADAI